MQLSYDETTRTARVEHDDGTVLETTLPIADPPASDPIGDLLDGDGNVIASGSVDDLVAALGVDLKRRSDGRDMSDDRLDDFIEGWAAKMQRRAGTDDDEFHGMGSKRMRIPRR